MSAEDPFASWAILELMGHRRLAGYVTEVVIGGGALLRIDVPAADGEVRATQFYGGSAVYCLTPCTEATARAVAASSDPAPVKAWELPALRRYPDEVVIEDEEDDGDPLEDDDG